MRPRPVRDFVGEEHHAELVHDDVERGIGEREVHHVRLLPRDRTGGAHGLGVIEHRLVEVGRRNGDRLVQACRECPSHDAAAGGNFKHVGRGERANTRGQVAGVRLEDQRNYVSVVELGHRAHKSGVGFFGAAMVDTLPQSEYRPLIVSRLVPVTPVRIFE